MPLSRGYIHVYDHNIQTSSSLNSLGQSKPNMKWSIVRKGERTSSQVSVYRTIGPLVNCRFI